MTRSKLVRNLLLARLIASGALLGVAAFSTAAEYLGVVGHAPVVGGVVVGSGLALAAIKFMHIV